MGKSAKEADIVGNVEMGEMMPTMTVAPPPMPVMEEKECIVKDEQILGLYDEILNHCRSDRKNIDDVLTPMIDMVINNGDAAQGTKEAMVNLFKIKSDCADKMAKIADLMTRIKLRDRDTYKAYYNNNQNNKVTVEVRKSPKDALRDILKNPQIGDLE